MQAVRLDWADRFCSLVPQSICFAIMLSLIWLQICMYKCEMSHLLLVQKKVITFYDSFFCIYNAATQIKFSVCDFKILILKEFCLMCSGWKLKKLCRNSTDVYMFWNFSKSHVPVSSWVYIITLWVVFICLPVNYGCGFFSQLRTQFSQIDYPLLWFGTVLTFGVLELIVKAERIRNSFSD